MDKNNSDDRVAIYELSYLIGDNIPEEKVPAEAESIKKIIADAGAEIITDEAPHKESIAYTMRKKTVSGAYDKFDQAYFGWVKFELSTSKIESVKKMVEVVPCILRTLIITTVRENTFLGKRAAAILVKTVPGEEEKKEVIPANPATVEEMDKSIDDMVKEV